MKKTLRKVMVLVMTGMMAMENAICPLAEETQMELEAEEREKAEAEMKAAEEAARAAEEAARAEAEARAAEEAARAEAEAKAAEEAARAEAEAKAAEEAARAEAEARAAEEAARAEAEAMAAEETAEETTEETTAAETDMVEEFTEDLEEEIITIEDYDTPLGLGDMMQEPEIVYGTVSISTSRNSETKPGDTITLTSSLSGFENVSEYVYQWEYIKDGAVYTASGANGSTYSYVADEDSIGWGWQLVVYCR